MGEERRRDDNRRRRVWSLHRRLRRADAACAAIEVLVEVDDLHQNIYNLVEVDELHHLGFIFLVEVVDFDHFVQFGRSRRLRPFEFVFF